MIEDYIGRQFVMGSTDCFGVLRDYYQNEFGLTVPNYARPNDFWDSGMDLYTPRLKRLGFKVVEDILEGDVILMAIQAERGNHAAAVIENGQILHHFFGRMSSVDNYTTLWRNTTIAVFRHPEVRQKIIDAQSVTEIDYTTIISPRKMRMIHERIAREAVGGE